VCFLKSSRNLAYLTFQSGKFQTKFRTAQIISLLKQQELDATNPSNYRPIFKMTPLARYLSDWFGAHRIAHHLIAIR
jgi:hypothetical protein